MAIIDLVKWNADDETLAWRFPSDQLATWTQLIVAESQEAMLVHGGQMEGPFAAGRHTLTTENLPILSGLFGIPFGGKSPFTAEVVYVNRSIPLDVGWAIDEPIQLKDPEYQVMLPVVASGQYGVAIEHTKRFLVQIVGTKPSFTRGMLQRYLHGVIVTKAKDLISRSLVEKRISILDLPSHLNELSDALRSGIEVEITKYGLRLDSFYVSSLNPVDTDESVKRLKTALADNAARKIQGFTYQQERSLDVLESAAANEGSGSDIMGSGLGLGMGASIGGAIGHAMTGVSRELAPLAPLPEPPAAPRPDRLAVLRELAQMRAEGVLTDEEFAQEKRRILGDQ
jgi:membrane protease subunit (stomatin/prohibitin family)